MMYFGRFLSLPVILTLTLVVAGAGSTTVWVAPNEESCQERTPCGTLQDLWLSDTGVNIINESNATWIFLPGSHIVNSTADKSVAFFRVSNIVLIGDTSCEKQEQNCTIVCTSYLCVFLFIESNNITIKHLRIVYDSRSYLPKPDYTKWEITGESSICHYLFNTGYFSGVCNESSFHLNITSWMFVVVSGVRIDSLRLVGYNSQITVYNLKDSLKLLDVNFLNYHQPLMNGVF